MCMEGVSNVVMTDGFIQAKMQEAGLDFVHLQVLMNLYSLQMNNGLEAYRETLPVYLSMELEKCELILKEIEEAGLITRAGGIISLVREIDTPDDGLLCGCH